MKAIIVTKIKNGKITLPKSIQKTLGKREVVVLPAGDGIYIKPITPPSLSDLGARISKVSSSLNPQDVKKAITWARKKTYSSRV